MQRRWKSADVKQMAELIIKSNGGRAYFNLTEARKITGYGENTIARRFHNAGILVQTSGRDKRVSAYDIAELMCDSRVAPVG